MGTGKSLAEGHWQAMDISHEKGCKGVYRIVDTTPIQTATDLNVALDCGGKTGGGVAAPFKFVLNGQKLDGCSLFTFNVNPGWYFLLCAPSQTAVDECAKSQFDSVAAQGPPHTSPSLSVPTFIFHPN